MSYKFSVICPVYNMEQYIQEAFESIKKQTIGFEENIQVVFVNDGSIDESEKKCLELKSNYPDNILYIKKENGGVSSARNVGIDNASGDYLVFLDPDDKWDLHAFERIGHFFDVHQKEVDVCSCKMDYFGDFAGKAHPLDFRFENNNRVVDLSQEPEYVNTTIGNVIVKRSAVGVVRFNELISSGEDSAFTNSILLQKLKVGVISDAVFFYRRNNGDITGSSSAPRKKSWYLDVPKEYYLGLYKVSKDLYGDVVPYIQEVILYDLRWRYYRIAIESCLSEREKQEYIGIMQEVLSFIEDRRIQNATGLSQYQKLYLLQLKHGERLAEEVHVEKAYIVNNSGLQLYNFRSKTFFSIKTIEFEDGNVLLRGITFAGVLGKKAKLFLKDEKGTSYEIKTYRYESFDKKGYIGEIVAEAYGFFVSVPLCHKRKLTFYAIYEGIEIQLNPGYGVDTGLERYTTSFTVIGNYVLKHIRGKLCFYNKTTRIQIASRHRYIKTMSQKDNGEEIIEKHIQELSLKKLVNKKKLKNQVAFVSVRGNDILLPNLAAVYDKCTSRKTIFARKTPFTEEDLLEGINVFYSSKVVVTDDYCLFLRKFGKKEGQTIIQLWHAAGAFKKFAQDGTEIFIPVDRLYHKYYDVVAVSAPSLVEIYAHAFGIDNDKVKPLGVPRTDIFFDDEYTESIRKKIYAAHPEFEGKEIIIYAPTFRAHDGQNRRFFHPNLDFQLLSDSLKDNQVFLICPHPIMENEIVDKNYKNIYVMRDFSTNDYMMIADLLITDYSSVIFEFSILNKPIAFFCYDYNTYNRDFYLDYEMDLPGPLIKSQGELIDYLKTDNFSTDARMIEFKEKYMSACDGHSAERIAKLVDSYISHK